MCAGTTTTRCPYIVRLHDCFEDEQYIYFIQARPATAPPQHHAPRTAAARRSGSHEALTRDCGG